MVVALGLLRVEWRGVVRLGVYKHFVVGDDAFPNVYELVFVALLYGGRRHVHSGSYHHSGGSVAAAQRLRYPRSNFHRHVAARTLWQNADDDDSRDISLAVQSVQVFEVELKPELHVAILSRAKAEVARLFFVFALICVCFAFLASGSWTQDTRVSQLGRATMSLLRLSVGLLDVDYQQLTLAHGFWAPAFIVAFVFIAVLTAINVFMPF